MRRLVRKVRGGALLGALVPYLLLAGAAASTGCGEDPETDGGGGTVKRPPPIPPGGSGGGGSGGTGGAGGSGGTGGSGGSTAAELRVDDVRPPRGSLLGGDSVIINGAGFVQSVEANVRPNDVTKVFFGGNEAVGVRVIDDDTILVPTPPGNEGDADVVVRNTSGESVCTACYRYQAPVELFSVEPAEGSIHGGAVLALRGQNLRESMIVLVGGRAALQVQAQNDGSLTAILPPGDAAGPVDVRVYDADGQASLRKAFTYVAPLRIARLDPPGGPLAGGNRVTVVGSGFTADAEVFVGGARAASVLDDDGTLDVTVPPGVAPGAVDFEVRTPAGSAVAGYAYFDPQAAGVALYAVSPGIGSLAGGDTVTLVGTHLDGLNLAVRFDGILAADAVATSANFVSATVPAGAAPGPVDVSVRVADGGATLPGGFRYVETIEVDAVTPASGPEAGGTAIALTGSGFPARVRVFVGALEATAVERRSSTSLRAVTPAGTDGTVPVRVVDADDPSSEGVLAAGFAYEGAFDVLRSDPTTGARAGGTRVTLRGRGFRPGLAASFGATAAASVAVQDPFTAVLVTPRGNVGTVDVTVDSGAGDQVTLDGAFTYFDPTNANGGSSGGPLNGTLNITVLDGGNARRGVPLPNVFVMLGTDDDTHLQGLTDNRGQITFSDPTLVKAQVVSAALSGYESTTVVNQQSENLTMVLTPNFEPPECANGLDDDGDGLIDNDGAGDPAKADVDGCLCGPNNSPMPDLCMCPMNPQESASCCDGLDNDGDGLIDSDDPECQCSGGSSEGPLAQCSNCKDDDGDGTTDWFNPRFPPDPGCANGGDNDERGAIVAGRVWGFKLPGGRQLAPNEQEVAFVRVSVPSAYHAPPMSGAQSPLVVGTEGGSFAYEFASSRFMALYAVYGIQNLDTNEFTPLLMGVRRGVNPTPGNNITNADIILDMHLDLDVPVAIDNPPTWLGAQGESQVFAYMDLGNEGVIPVGSVITSTSATQVTLRKLPRLSGESFLFHLRGTAGPGIGVPFTASFRRQAGDLSRGITMGPLLGLTRMLQPTPAQRFAGVFDWTAENGPTADIAYLQIDEPTPTGALIPQWHIVVPGNERRVSVPPEVLQRLRNKYDPGTALVVTHVTGVEPRFSYDQWNYQNLFVDAFTSFTVDQFLIQL